MVYINLRRKGKTGRSDSLPVFQQNDMFLSVLLPFEESHLHADAHAGDGLIAATILSIRAWCKDSLTINNFAPAAGRDDISGFEVHYFKFQFFICLFHQISSYTDQAHLCAGQPSLAVMMSGASKRMISSSRP